VDIVDAFLHFVKQQHKNGTIMSTPSLANASCFIRKKTTFFLKAVYATSPPVEERPVKQDPE